MKDYWEEYIRRKGDWERAYSIDGGIVLGIIWWIDLYFQTLNSRRPTTVYNHPE